MSAKIIYDIGFNLDKTGVNGLRSVLKELKKEARINIKGDEAKQEISKINKELDILDTALNRSYNPKLDSHNILEFNKQLKASNISLTQIYDSIKRASGSSDTASAAFSKMAHTLGKMRSEGRETNKFLDDMAKTLANTARWTISSSILNNFTSAIQQAWGFTKSLDASLNNIRIVTGKSNEDMEKFAKNANRAAQSLGASTTDYTNAALIYYQQGLGQKDVKARTDVTVKVANITKQSTSEVSEQLTAIWNGYKVSAQEAELYIDKVSAVAANTAADLEELADGMSKVASAANAMGVDIDQLNAMLATTISVTRQDASSVGTAYKTIFARMGDLAVGGEDEFGVKLGDVSGKLKQMGVDVLDQTGNLRDMGTVIEEVAAKWGTWTDAQQQAAAVAIAGKRQYNNLMSLFENWDMYENALSTSKNAEGTLEQQQTTFLQSLEAKLQKVSTSLETVFMKLLDSDDFKDILDWISDFVLAIGDLIDRMGGLKGVLLALGGVLTSVFSEQISKEIMRISHNIFQASTAAKEYKLYLSMAKEAEAAGDERSAEVNRLYADKIKYEKYLSNADKERFNSLMKEKEAIAEQIPVLNERARLLSAKIGFNASDFYGKNEKFEQQYAASIEDFKAKHQADIQNINQYDLENPDRQRLQTKSSAKTPETRLNKANASLDKLIPKETLQRLQDAGINIEQLENKMDDYRKAIVEGKDATYEADKVVRVYDEVLNKEKEVIDQVTKEHDELNRELNETKDSSEKASKGLKQITDSAKGTDIINKVSQGIGAITQAISLVTQFVNLFKVLSDESVSAEEKSSAVFTSLLTLVPMVFSTMAAIGTATGLATQAAWGWISVVVTAVIALAGLVVGIILGVKTEEQRLNEAIEKTEEDINNLKSAIEETRKELDELNTTFNELDEVSKTLEGLTKGSEEWQKVIDETNQKVLELIDSYSWLSQYITMDENGMLVIDEVGKEKLKEETRNTLLKQQRELFLNQNKKSDLQEEKALSFAQKDKVIQDFNEETFDSFIYKKGGAGRDYQQETTMGQLFSELSREGKILMLQASAEGNLFSNDADIEKIGLNENDEAILKNLKKQIDINTVLKASSNGRSYTGVKDEFTYQSASSDAEKLLKYYNINTKTLDWEAVKQDSTFSDGFIAAISTNSEQAEKLRKEYAQYAKTVSENTLALRTQTQTYISTVFGNDENYQKSSEKGMFSDIAAGIYADKAKASESDFDTYNAKSKDGKRNDTKYRKRIAAAYGVEYDKVYTDKNGAVTVNGEVKDAEELKNKIATYEAEQQALSKSDDINNLVESYYGKDGSRKDYNALLGLNGKTRTDLSDMKISTLNDIKGKVNNDEEDNEFNYWDQLIAAGISEEQVKIITGYNSKNEYKQALNQSIIDSESKVNAAYAKMQSDQGFGDLYDNTTDKINSFVAQGATVEDIELLAKATTSRGASDPNGAYDATAFRNLFTNYTGEKSLELTRLFSNTDWTKSGAVQSFAESFFEATGENILNNASWGEFSKEMFSKIQLSDEEIEDLGYTTLEFDNLAKALQKSDAEMLQMIRSTQTLSESLDLLANKYEDMSVEEKAANIATRKGLITGSISNRRSLIEASSIESAANIVDENGKISQSALNSFLQNRTEYELIYGKEAVERYVEDITGLMSDQDSLVELTISTFEDMMSLYDDYQDKLEKSNDLLQVQSDLYALLKGDLTGTFEAGIVKSQNDNILNGLASATSEFLTYADTYIDGTEELSAEAEKNLVSSAQEILKYAQNYIANLDKIFDAGLKGIIKTQLSGKSLDYVNEEWDYQKTKDNKYLDNINKAYGLDSLERAYEKEANAYAGNLSAQKKINDAKKTELDLLKTKANLSQADLDRANAKLSVLQAEIALEEAQRNATEMQLTRDASGNYGYTFVASEDKIAEAEERLAEAQNELYNLDKERVIALQDEYLALWTEFDSEIKEAMKISDEGERNARIEQIKAQYSEQFSNLKSEFNDVVDQAGTSVAGIVNTSIKNAIDSDLFAEGGALSKLIADRVAEAKEIEKILYGDEDKKTSGVIDALGKVATALTDNNTLSDLQTDVGTIAEQLPFLVTTLGNLELNNPPGSGSTNHSGGSGGNSGGGSGGNVEEEGKTEEPTASTNDKVTIGDAVDTTIEAIGNAVVDFFNWGKNLFGFDTGGYTGEWGNSGRLALLHEKELVLNKEDTANILYAVDLVRSIMGGVGDLSSLFAEGAASVDFSGSAKVANGYEQLVQELLQNVKIEANFPGVTDRNEIQAAIDNLISLAEQKANER